MNYLLASLFFLINFCSFSQHDTLVITTDITVDSIYHLNHRLDFSQVNDSVLKMTIKRNLDSTNNQLIIYSGTKTYQSTLPANPETAFPGEWKFRDPEYPMNIHACIKKDHFVTLTASGSSVNLMSSLAVYGSDGELILEESVGVYVVNQPRARIKKTK